MGGLPVVFSFMGIWAPDLVLSRGESTWSQDQVKGRWLDRYGYVITSD